MRQKFAGFQSIFSRNTEFCCRRTGGLLATKPQRILDVGCGSGVFTRMTQKEFRPKLIVAVDADLVVLLVLLCLPVRVEVTVQAARPSIPNVALRIAIHVVVLSCRGI